MNAPHDLPLADDDDIARLRRPPHSVEAEQSVLGALLLDNLAWDRVADLLAERDFYLHEHRAIWRAIAELVLAGQPADAVTVHERLAATGHAADAQSFGGLAYLGALSMSVPGSQAIRRYAEIVRERAILRQLISAADEIATAAFSLQGRTVQEVLGLAEEKVLAIGAHAVAASGYRTADRLAIEVLDRINELHERGRDDEVVGVSTGFRELDRLTTGLQGGDLVVLAARPSMGKTAFAMNIAEHVAVKNDLPVGVFSMEMSASQIVARMLGSIGLIHQQAIRTGRLKDDEWGRLADANEKLSKAAICIDESGGLTVNDLRSKARRMARDCGGQMGLFVIDYLQLMSGTSGSEENRATQLGEISRGLKAMAKELRCPVIAISQLNRSVESRGDKRPLMSDLRESGAIEQDADVILFIYRDDYYTKDLCKEPGVAEIIIAKQRSGPIDTVKLAWNGKFTKFLDLPRDYVPRGGGQPAAAAGFDE